MQVLIIMFISAIASAFVDNIPFAATMVPVIKSLAATTAGADLSVLAYALSIGTDIGGSATPIALRLMLSVHRLFQKAGHRLAGEKYCKTAIPATAIVLVIAMVVIKFRYF